MTDIKKRLIVYSMAGFVLGLTFGWLGVSEYFKTQDVGNLEQKEIAVRNLEKTLKLVQAKPDAPDVEKLWSNVLDIGKVLALTVRPVSVSELTQEQIALGGIKSYAAEVNGNVLDVLTGAYYLHNKIGVQLHSFEIDQKQMSLVVSLSGK